MPSQFLDLAVPTRARNHTPHDTNVLPANTMGISVTVTTAGILKVRMWGDTTDTELDLAIGMWQIPGNFKIIYTTSQTAVITGTRVVCWIFDPSTVNY